ncbi:MAG: LPS export ABC transporter periplasmic protein LptC [Candidatus Omnitrophica bacterium]|nr:LPS export ABC transporter periplasmic protein LptC [Candidatus Omnitrophota bacterium]
MRLNKVATALLVVFLFTGCEGKQAKAPAPPEEEAEISGDQKMMAFSLSGFEKTGKKKWEIQGKSADIVSEVVNLTDIVAKAYGDQSDMTLTADKGSFDRATNDAHFESNVVVSGTNGTEMKTDALDWKNAEQKVVTDKPVVMKSDAKGKSVGEFATKTPTTITCDGPMEIDYGKSYAVFNKNVKVEDERGQVFCDTATAYYDTKTKQVSKIVARGNVKIMREGSWTYSDEAIYLAPEQKVILTGSPKVMIYPEDKKEKKK